MYCVWNTLKAERGPKTSFFHSIWLEGLQVDSRNESRMPQEIKKIDLDYGPYS